MADGQADCKANDNRGTTSGNCEEQTGCRERAGRSLRRLIARGRRSLRCAVGRLIWLRRLGELERVGDARREGELALFEARVVELGQVVVIGDLEQVPRDVEQLAVGAHAVARKGILRVREEVRTGRGAAQEDARAPCMP